MCVGGSDAAGCAGHLGCGGHGGDGATRAALRHDICLRADAQGQGTTGVYVISLISLISGHAMAAEMGCPVCHEMCWGAGFA